MCILTHPRTIGEITNNDRFPTKNMNDPLKDTLEKWQVPAEPDHADADFRRAVWSRLESSTSPVDHFFQRPLLWAATAAVAMAAILTVAAWQGSRTNDRHWNALTAQYAFSIDPGAMASAQSGNLHSHH